MSKTGASASSGTELCVASVQEPFSQDQGAVSGQKQKGRDLPTPKQVTFSLCTRAALSWLSNALYKQAVGWFSHLCVCRYINFVLKEGRPTPASGGVFVMPLSVPSRPWAWQGPGELTRFHSVM